MIILDLSTWWSSIETLEKMYWFFTVPSSIAFLVIMVTTFFLGEVDSDMDSDMDIDDQIDSDHGQGFHFLTVKNLISFFAIFSWSGLACINSGFIAAVTISVSIFCGLVMMTIMATIFYFMSKLKDSGTLNLRNSIGKIGEVYLVIPADRKGFGKVQIKVQGSLRTLNALTDGEEIKTGLVIEVLDVVSENILLVKKCSKK